MHAIATEMLDLQDRMNRLVNDGWTEAGFAWPRAIWLECGELVEHLPWKWWKSGGEPNFEQVRFEVVDILHFVLSWTLVHSRQLGEPRECAVERVQTMLEECSRLAEWYSARVGVAEPAAIIEAAERVAAAALSKSLPGAMVAFSQLAGAVGLGTAALRSRYIGKNALNVVRNRLGYAQGTYQKTWAGEEDNVHLERLMSAARDMSVEALVDALVERYRGLFG